MICPECGKENKEGAKFCKNCGASLSDVQSNIHKENVEKVKSDSCVASSTINSSSSGSSGGTKNTLIICITAIICVAIIAGAVLLLNSPAENVSDTVVVNDSSDSVNESTDDAKTSESSSSESSTPKGSTSTESMTFAEAEPYLSGASATVIRNTFDEADADGDGVLTGSEINRFKYLADLTDRTADTSNSEHVEAQDYGGTGDGTTKTRYCTTHGRVAVGSDNRCPYCEAEGLDSRTVKGSTEYI